MSFSAPTAQKKKKGGAGTLQQRAGPWVTVLRLVSTLERDPPTYLEEPWCMRSSRSTEAPIGNVHIDICIVSPVEDVEQFKPELEVDAFRDRCVFVEVCIRLKEVRSTELHGFFVTFRSEGRGSEVCLWNRPRSEEHTSE